MEEKKHTFLLVDDDSFFRMLLRQILRDEDFEVVGEASNGEEAVRKCAELVPSVVLLDIVMPKLDGINALRIMKKLRPDVPAITYSGNAGSGEIAESVKAGAIRCFTKPFEISQLLGEVRKYQSRHAGPRS